MIALHKLEPLTQRKKWLTDPVRATTRSDTEIRRLSPEDCAGLVEEGEWQNRNGAEGMK